ncbi:putative UDP-glucuronate:xylan alpha-glucuronosyltransferase 4 [Glycine soja]
MASNKSSPSRSHSRIKRFLICLVLMSLPLLFFVLSEKQKRVTKMLEVDPKPRPRPAWFDVIAKGIINNKKKIKVGLVNIDARVDGSIFEQLDTLDSQVETISIDFDHVDKNLKWEDIFPEWIDENGKWGQPKCPNLPMPALQNYGDLNVVVAKVPCGIRDVFRLQVNLVVANLAVESGWVTKMESDHRKVHVVFVGSCGPMVEIFRCDDLLMHRPEYWVYRPDLRRLKHQTLMPLGSCQIAPGYAETGKEAWRIDVALTRVPKLAYVTVLHSSEAYVCGAIALAQSILGTQTMFIETDLVLLADNSIGPQSTAGLKAAGWKIKRIQRILSPFAKKGAYNQWNYSKLRMWQLTTYDKIIFIDSDLLVLRSIHHLFVLPQLSAAPNEKTLFNSGLMVIEPSQCMFQKMMNVTSKVRSYNGGDQGFLNEIFTWWHRLPAKVNQLKTFPSSGHGMHELPDDVYAVHYLGLKPWMCYRDYDCNWDMQDRHVFASDSAHRRWWQVYDAMPKELQAYCGLTEKMNERIVKWRRIARNASFSDGHWKIKVQDPRRGNYYSD